VRGLTPVAPRGRPGRPPVRHGAAAPRHLLAELGGRAVRGLPTGAPRL